MPSMTRRSILLALTSLPFSVIANATNADMDFSALEDDLGGVLGIAAIDSENGCMIGYREKERFPMCSTFKVVLSAAILAQADKVPGLLDKQVTLAKSYFVSYSPITGKHVDGRMSIADLCAAALQYSDNTAGNALLRELGGPVALTDFARALGDESFSLDRWETELNAAVPSDERDTTTPLAMARTLQKLLLKDGLSPTRQHQLRVWMLGNTTGDMRIRRAVSTGWQVADKTGTGDYGSANDIAVIYPPNRDPVTVAIFTRQLAKNAEPRSDLIVRATRMSLDALDRRYVKNRLTALSRPL